MTVIWIVLGVALAALVIWLLAVGFGAFGVKVPVSASAKPANSPAEAIAKFSELQARDTADVAPACASALLEPEGDVKATIVLFHGFTNCPNQPMKSALLLRDQGYRVLLPRQPRHGLADVLNHSLKDLTVEELTTFTSAAIDIAHGWSEPVYVAGLSVGAILAAWAAATRGEVKRVLLLAPFVAPNGVPTFVVRWLIVLHRFIPGIYWWWDPRKKENLGESPYVYPGFPLPGMVPYLHLADVLDRRKVVVGHRLDYAGLTTNPGDFAIRKDRAKDLFVHEFTGQTDALVEWTIDADLKWWHDFVDPDGSHPGTPEQVAAVFASGLGLSDDAKTQGLMTADELGAKA